VVLDHRVAEARPVNVVEVIVLADPTHAANLDPPVPRKAATTAAIVPGAKGPAGDAVHVTSVNNTNDANRHCRCPTSASLCFPMIKASNRWHARFE
jgi:hypothetical protein